MVKRKKMSGSKENTTMKKMMTNIKTLAALLIASATLAACSSDDNISSEQPANPTGKYIMTVQASKGDAAATRGLYYGTDGALNVKWNEGEQVEVVQTSGTTSKSLGTLKAKASTDGITTLTGELVGLQTDAQLKFYLHGSTYDYTGQTGVLLSDANSIEKKYDYAFAATYDYTIDGSNVTVPSGINLEAQQSIVKFTLVDDSDNPVNVTSLKIDTKNYIIEKIDNVDPTGNTQGSKSMTITPTSGTNVIYVAIRNTEPNKDRPNDYTLTATTADGKEYTYKKTDVTFKNGKYYEVTVKMKMSVTEWALGKILGADGNIYNTKADAEAVATGNAVAMIAYVGKVPGYFDNFLAISMHDCKPDGTEGREVNASTWRTYIHQNSVGTYAANHPIKIGDNTYNTASYFPYVENSNPIVPITYDEVADNNMTASNTNSTTLKGWRMPTITDWRYILYGLCGSPVPTDPAGVANNYYLGTTNPLDILNDSPGYGLDLSNDVTFYCTSSGVSGQTEHVWYLRFNTSKAPLVETGTDHGAYCYLRPVFAY